MKKSILVFIIFILICIPISCLITDLSQNKTDDGIEEEKTLNNNYYDSIFKSELKGDSWPITALTKQIPKPSTGTLKIKQMGRSSIAFSVSDLELQDYYNYIQSAKEYGFTNNSSDSNGYRALNSDEYLIHIYFSNNTMDVSITY